MGFWRTLFGTEKPEPLPSVRIPPVTAKPQKPQMQMEALLRATELSKREKASNINIFEPAKPMPGVAPEGLAMDEALVGQNYGVEYDGVRWLGYPYLAELAQRPEYRRISETIAREMTRKWIKLSSTSSDGNDEKIKLIEAALRKFRVQEKFRRVAELDGFFGRGHLFIDLGNLEREELKTPLVMSKVKVRKGGLKGFRVVEPTWTYPGMYNSNDPLDEHFYRPRTWFVMAKEVHRTRLLTFIGRELPDLLRPAYSFGGLSMSQMAKPYVDNWLRTRQSVSDMLHSFSTNVFSTDMSSIMNQGGGAVEVMRAQLFNALRDNSGLFMIDKDKEDFKNISASLGGLDHLQAQSQEQMSSVSALPLIILLGITPTGLNASSDGELQVHYANIKAMQELLFADNLQIVLNILQLHLFGQIDESISFEFEPLKEESEAERQAGRKQEADTDAVLVGVGAIGPDDVRKRLASDPDSPYASIDLSEPAPGPPEADPMGDPSEDPLAHTEQKALSHALDEQKREVRT